MPQPLKTKTGSKITTKTLVVASLALAGAGLFVAAVSQNNATMVCGSGSRAGQPCATDRDCRTGALSDMGALCKKVLPPRPLPDLQLFGAVSRTNASSGCVLNHTCAVEDIYGSVQVVNVGGGTPVNPFTMKFGIRKADGTIVPLRIYDPTMETSYNYNAVIKIPGFTQSPNSLPVLPGTLTYSSVHVSIASLTGSSAQGPNTAIEIPMIISRSFLNETGQIPADAAQLVVTVDDGDSTRESNEGNNYKVYTLPDRLPMAMSTSALPDLVINDGIPFGADGTPVFQIANRGSAASPELPGTRLDNRGYIETWLDAGHEIVRSAGVTPQNIYGPLPSLSPRAISPSYAWGPPPPSARYVKVVVDPDHQVTESNEDNNTFERAIPRDLTR